MDWEQIDRQLEEILGPPLDAPKHFPAFSRTLDEMLASRSHVRVLRVLATTDPKINLTARDVARMAGVSHARALEVLRELISIGIVGTYRGLSYASHWYEEEHPLAEMTRALFEEERRGATRSSPTAGRSRPRRPV